MFLIPSTVSKPQTQNVFCSVESVHVVSLALLCLSLLLIQICWLFTEFFPVFFTLYDMMLRSLA